MKNAILGALVALVMLTGTASAQDHVLKFENLQWRFPSSTGAVNKFVDRKFLAADSASAAGKDTTTWISTEGWRVPLGGYAVAATDSLALARFIIYVDSSYTVPQGSFDATIQGAFSGDNNLAFSITVTVNPTTGQKFFEVPIYLKSTSLTGVHPSGWNRLVPLVRLIVHNKAGNFTTVGWRACRVGVTYLGNP